MEKGNIQKWHLKEGDQFGPGDVLAAIETDKAAVEFEMQEDGFIAKLLYPEGHKDIPLGVPIAIVVDSAEDVAAFKDYKVEASAQAAPAAPAAPAKEEPAKTQAPEASA